KGSAWCRPERLSFLSPDSGNRRERAVSNAGEGYVVSGFSRAETHMFITKTSLPRRTFLGGVGASLALPLLDAMVPAATALAQTAAQRPPRFGFIYVPHGADMA